MKMKTLHTFRDCGGSDHIRPFMKSRREFLHVGLLGGLGLGLPELLRMEANAAQKQYESKEGKAKSVIHIFLPGGMAQQETFDPKPYAPSEYRGPLTPIDTKITGVKFGPHFKELAKVSDKLTVLNSLTHGEAAHERGVHNMFTGYRPSPAIRFPSFGSVVSHEFGPRNNLPPYVCVPSQPNEFAGQRLSQLGVRPVQPRQRSGERQLLGARSLAARRDRHQAVREAPQHARNRGRSLPHP